MSILTRLTRTLEAAQAGALRMVSPSSAGFGAALAYWDDPIGRRRFQRIPMHGRRAEMLVLSRTARTTVRVRMLDLSAGGARISGGDLAAVEPATRVRISVPLPNGGIVLGAPAVVIWVQHGLQGSTAGLEFREISADDQRRIAQAIANPLPG